MGTPSPSTPPTKKSVSFADDDRGKGIHHREEVTKGAYDQKKGTSDHGRGVQHSDMKGMAGKGDCFGGKGGDVREE
eukprot:8884513-Pyramimonas_sp.AAC.1